MSELLSQEEIASYDVDRLDALIAKTEEAIQEKLGEESNVDTPEGFYNFFKLMHGTPVHKEGEKWIGNAFKAHEEGRGSANEVHREGSKTTIFAKFFLAWRIGLEPELCNMVVRINDTKGNETTDAIAQIIEHDPRWALAFPNVVPDKEKGWGEKGYHVKRADISYREWAKIKTELPPYPTFVGYGWKSGSIIGSRINGVLVVDDIHDEENTKSDTQLMAVKKFYTDVLDYCLMEDAWEIWNFTPWTENDTYAYIKSTGEYIHSYSPVMIEAKEGEGSYWEPMVMNADDIKTVNIPYSGKWWHLTWPEQWGFERLAKKYRKSGDIGFARQMLLDLSKTKGLVLKKDWLEPRFPHQDIKKDWPAIIFIDYTSTEDPRKAKADYFALAVGQIAPDMRRVIISDGLYKRVTHLDAQRLAIAKILEYPVLYTVGIEAIFTGSEYRNTLAENQELIDNSIYPEACRGGPWGKSKGHRFEYVLADAARRGIVQLSDAENELLAAIPREWIGWQGDALADLGHDDALDAMFGVVHLSMQFLAHGKKYKERDYTNPAYPRKKKENPFNFLRSKNR